MNVQKYTILFFLFFIKKETFYSLFSGGFGNNGNMSGGYRAPVNAGPPPPQQNYGHNYGGDNAGHPPPSQQTYYGQPATPVPPQQTQIYHQSIPNAYQQMGQIPRPMNPPQPIDNRGYGQTAQHRMPMQNRS
jgi:hypothetical protein